MTQRTISKDKPEKTKEPRGFKWSQIPCYNDLVVFDTAEEIIEKAKSKDPSETNEFYQMRLALAMRIADYYKIRKECSITDRAHIATINRKAWPFLKGHFTLAVVGKTSSGKSTFINTLIGDNLFPTGRYQTTHTLSFIEQGNKVKMEVLFCDEQKKVYDNAKEIKEKLKELVAIPEEYTTLPVNDINRLISEDKGVAEILREKPAIEKRTHTQNRDESWKQYVNSHTKKDIAKEVYITYTLADEYQGWRIIDTPGVGTTGGIQDITKMLFEDNDDESSEKPDAIVFLHSAVDNIQDQEAQDFMAEVVNGSKRDAKSRLFFVITNASDIRFRSEKERMMQLAESEFATPFKIPKERVTYIDSLLERFNNEVVDKEIFKSLKCPSNWDKCEWQAVTELYTLIESEINRRGKEMANDSIKEVVSEWSNFGHLKSLLNSFLREEKSVAFKEICLLIEKDYAGFINDWQREIEILENNKDIQEEKDSLRAKRVKYDDLLNRIQSRASIGNIWPQFSFVDDTITGFSNLENTSAIAATYHKLMEKVEEKEKEIIASIKNEFNEYITKDLSNSFARLEMIDLDDIEQKVKEKMKTEKKRHLIVWLFDRIKNLFTKDDTKKARRIYINLVIKEAQQHKKEFKSELKTTIAEYCDLISKEINGRFQDAEEKLQELEKELHDIDKQQVDNRIAKLKTNLEIIGKLQYK